MIVDEAPATNVQLESDEDAKEIGLSAGTILKQIQRDSRYADESLFLSPNTIDGVGLEGDSVPLR